MIDDKEALHYFVNELDAFKIKSDVLRLQILDGVVGFLKNYKEEEKYRYDKDHDQLPLFGLWEK